MKQRSGSLTMKQNVMNEATEAVTSIEDALALIGGFGRFQWLSSFITMGVYMRAAYTYYPLPYLELYPVYMCTSAASPTPYKCKPIDFCSDPSITATIDYNDSTSLHNFV